MRSGRISKSRTQTPRRTSCHAASLPASPAPITLTIGPLMGRDSDRLRAGWRSLWGRRRGSFDRSLVAAFLVGALPTRALALGDFLDQVGRPALRTRLRHDAVPACKFALRVAAASEEKLPAAAPALEDLAFFAFGARDAGANRGGT